jgi:hypothetical protein
MYQVKKYNTLIKRKNYGYARMLGENTLEHPSLLLSM